MEPNIPKELIEQYRRSIPEKISHIEELFRNLESKITLEGVEALRFAFHKLAGNAGTYGYGEVSDLSKNAETRLKMLIQTYPEAESDPTWLPELKTYFARIRQIFH